MELPDDALERGNPGEKQAVREDYFGESQPVEHPFGVLYQGDWETPFDGSAVAVRKHATALRDAGLPVVLKSFSNVVVSPEGVVEPAVVAGVPPEVKREIGTMNLTRVGGTVPLIKHGVIASAPRLAQLLMRGVTGPLDTPELRIGAQQAVYKSTIVYSVWERNRIHPDIAMHLSEVAECWVPSEHNKELLQRSGVSRVRVMPHPYADDEMVCKCRLRQPRDFRVPRFYAIGAWQPRKGFHELVGAFLRQFAPGDATSLTIKYSGGQWPGYPPPDSSVGLWLQDSAVRHRGWTYEIAKKRIALIGGRIPRSNIVELHYRNNIYVCSSKGEAWCLPAFDAKLAGNSLVHVPYGGTRDFAGPGDIEVKWSLEDVPDSYGWEPAAQWAGFDVWDLAQALGRAPVPRAFELPSGFRERFGREAVGKAMRSAVVALTAKLHREASAYYRSLP